LTIVSFGYHALPVKSKPLPAKWLEKKNQTFQANCFMKKGFWVVCVGLFGIVFAASIGWGFSSPDDQDVNNFLSVYP
jgi:hypothetical protein